MNYPETRQKSATKLLIENYTNLIMKKFVVMAVAALSLLMAGCKEQKAPIKV